MDYDTNQISKEINAVQKEIAAKKKVSYSDLLSWVPVVIDWYISGQTTR